MRLWHRVVWHTPQNFINMISNHNNLFYRRIRNKYIGFDSDSKITIYSILETVDAI
jgi:hypothetical protein